MPGTRDSQSWPAAALDASVGSHWGGRSGRGDTHAKPQMPHLECAGAQLELSATLLDELIHLSLDCDFLFLGQRSDGEGADHHLLPDWG